MAFRLEPVTLADRAAIADIIIRANFDDPYGQTVWPYSTFEGRTAGSHARLPATLLAPGYWLMKCTDTSTNTPIAYAQWRLPIKLWERVLADNGGGVLAEVTDQMRATFEREHAESCDADGEPKGMRLEVIEACSPAMEAANERCFPDGQESYMMLVQVKTLPSHQRRGAGQLLTQWGLDLANREGLRICLESTGFGKRLYEKCGFEAKEEVVHDLTRFGGPREYAWTMMVKEPEPEPERVR